ncbi:hypothetical protein [Herbiconiux sp. YIM B11900]|uniref:hypothetical protein n=1 Tax=Herbiconiux sp. YIM B11900 TaxID=3404131 RepID=UPI003F864DC7
MDVKALLTEAWAAVSEANIPDHLQEVAFREAIALLSRGEDASPKEEGAPRPPKAPKPRKTTGGSPRASSEVALPESPIDSTATASDLFDKLSSETGIEKSQLEDVFYFDAGTVGLNGPARKLGDNPTAQTRAVAIALGAAYYYLADEREISLPVIRAEAERLKCFDSKNFRNHMAKTPATSLVGPDSDRKLRVKNEIGDELKKVVNHFLGIKE